MVMYFQEKTVEFLLIQGADQEPLIDPIIGPSQFQLDLYQAISE